VETIGDVEWNSILTYPVGINPTVFTPNICAKLARNDASVATMIYAETIQQHSVTNTTE